VTVVALAFQLLLFFFPRTRSVAAYVLDSVLGSVYEFAATAWKNAPSIAFLLLVGVTTWYLLKLLRFFFQRLADGSVTIEGFRPAWAGTTQRLVSILLVVLAALIAYPYVPGSESPAFKGLSLFLGLLLSLGSTGLVANIVSGIMLTYMDQFQVGDMIRIGEFMARVKKTSMLTTQLQTRKNEIVSIPNALILTHEVTNLSSPGEKGLVINATIGVGYDVPWRQVESMMKLAASRTSGVSRSVEPFVFTLSLNQFDITYELNVHLEKNAPYWPTKSELNQNVLDAFNEFGVQIMTPAYEGDPDNLKVVPTSRWFSAPARERERSAIKSQGESFKQAG
jgi:small-conductance mechanosensitive channel